MDGLFTEYEMYDLLDSLGDKEEEGYADLYENVKLKKRHFTEMFEDTIENDLPDYSNKIDNIGLGGYIDEYEGLTPNPERAEGIAELSKANGKSDVENADLYDRLQNAPELVNDIIYNGGFDIDSCEEVYKRYRSEGKSIQKMYDDFEDYILYDSFQSNNLKSVCDDLKDYADIPEIGEVFGTLFDYYEFFKNKGIL